MTTGALQTNTAAVELDVQRYRKTLFLIFLVCCNIGYLYELIYYLVQDGALGNPGFLYGPYLPIYGIGGILFILFLKRFKASPAMVFLLGALTATSLEFFASALLEFVYHQRWWDYTGFFLNIQGRVCFASTILFALAALFMIYFLEPRLRRSLDRLSMRSINVLFYSTSVIFVFDLAVTVMMRY